MAKKALNNYMIEELDVRFLLEFIEDSQITTHIDNAQVEERNTAPPGIDPQPNSSAMMFMKTNCKVHSLVTRNSKQRHSHLRSSPADTTFKSTTTGTFKWPRRSSERKVVT